MNKDEIEAVLNDPDAIENIMNMIDIRDALEAMSAEKLVDVALAHLNDLSQPQELVLLELCSRIDPNWSSRDPDSKAKPGAES